MRFLETLQNSQAKNVYRVYKGIGKISEPGIDDVDITDEYIKKNTWSIIEKGVCVLWVVPFSSSHSFVFCGDFRGTLNHSDTNILQIVREKGLKEIREVYEQVDASEDEVDRLIEFSDLLENDELGLSTRVGLSNYLSKFPALENEEVGGELVVA